MPEDKEKPEAQRKRTEADRYERLQLAAERQLEKVGNAYELHARLIIQTVKYIGVAIGVLIAIAGALFYRGVSEMEANAVANVQKHIEIMTNSVAVKISQETNFLAGVVEQHFNKDNIDPLIVARVESRVKSVTEDVIRKSIHDQFDPEVAKIATNLSLVESDVSEAKKSEKDVKDGLNVAMNIVAALNDDRGAFVQLLTDRQTMTNSYQLVINGAITAIVRQTLVQDIQVPNMGWNLAPFDYNTNSFFDYVNLMNALTPNQPMVAAYMLERFSQQNRFTRDEKLLLYKYLIQKSPSLEMCSRACVNVDHEAHLNMTILGYANYLDWLDSQLDVFYVTNSTTVLATNALDQRVRFIRAQAYSSRTNYIAAINDYKRLLELNPTNDLAMNNLAWILATVPIDSFRNGKMAVDLAQRACNLSNWKSGSQIGTYASALAEVGDFENAVKFQKQAMFLVSPSDSQFGSMKEALADFQKKMPYREDAHKSQFELMP